MTDDFYAAPRSTEGSKKGVASHGANPEAHGRRPNKGGRPKGSKNKPKTLLPAELADEILGRMKDILPPEQMEYMRGVIRDGKAISTKNELDTIILLLSRNLTPALVKEMEPVDLGDGNEEVMFRKDITERLKILNSMLTLRAQIEKNEQPDSPEKPIIAIFERSGIDASRLAFLVGEQPRALVGGPDEAGRRADEVGAVSGEVLERQEPIPGGEQIKAVGPLDGAGRGNDGDGGDEEQL